MSTPTDTEYAVEPLTADTWPAYAAMLERHGGVFGGCWCTSFHTMSWEKTYDADDNRALKERLISEGRAHAALVMDGDRVVAWCQYGSPAELPNIRHRKEWETTTTQQPDFRITCIYVDREYRHRGLVLTAIRGAVDLIAGSGGGRVEGYPHDKGGKREAVLYSATRKTFEEAGFTYDRPKGKTNCVMYQQISARS